MLNTKPIQSIIDPVTKENIIQEIRHAIKKLIAQTMETDFGFGDLDFVVDDFLDFDMPDSEYNALQDAYDVLAYDEFHRIMSLLNAAFSPPVRRKAVPVRVK